MTFREKLSLLFVTAFVTFLVGMTIFAVLAQLPTQKEIQTMLEAGSANVQRP